MKKLFVTTHLPQDAIILLIDVEERYFDEVIEEADDPTEVEREVAGRLTAMKDLLQHLKRKGHMICSSTNGDVHPLIEDLVDLILPQWDTGQWANDQELDVAQRHGIHSSLVELCKIGHPILVCGLWKELCVYIVTRKLQEIYGDKVLLLDRKELTIENDFCSGSETGMSLQLVTERDNVSLITL